MPKFSIRNIFKNRDIDPDNPDGGVPEPRDRNEPPPEIPEIKLPPYSGPIPIEDNTPTEGGPLDEEPTNPNLPEEEEEPDTTVSESSKAPLLPNFPTSLAAGTFSLPGSGNFRQYQKPEDRSSLSAGIADDVIARRLRRSNAQRERL